MAANMAHPALQTALYNEHVNELLDHLLGLCPADIEYAARHRQETWFYAGKFPACVARSNGYANTPTEHLGNQLPGEMNAIVEFLFPSIGTMAEPDGASYAQAECLRLHSLWRAKLHDPTDSNDTMHGRYRMIEVLDMDEGDRDQYGNVRAADNDTNNILWVCRANVRAYQ